MFDIGFWELVLISVVGLVVLGPERLPVAIRSVSRFISGAKAMANGVKDELAQELKVQELHENLKKAENLGMEQLSPELKASVDALKKSAEEVQKPYANKETVSAGGEQAVSSTQKTEQKQEATSDNKGS